MTRVLLTGSTGFVGSHLADYLKLHTDWYVQCPTMDLTSELPEMGGAFDYIINLASLSSVEKSIADPVDFVENNVSIMLNVLEYAREHPPKRLLHLSSIEAQSPRNPYAASKAAQEALITAYHETYGLSTINVVSHNIIGPGQASEKFVPKVAEQIRKGEQVKIYMEGGVPGLRIYNTVENVCSGILFLLEKNKLPYSRDYLIDGGEALDNVEMALKIAKHLGKKLDYEMIEPNETRPGYSPFLPVLKVMNSVQALGWKPPQTLDQGLAWIK